MEREACSGACKASLNMFLASSDACRPAPCRRPKALNSVEKQKCVQGEVRSRPWIHAMTQPAADVWQNENALS